MIFLCVSGDFLVCLNRKRKKTNKTKNCETTILKRKKNQEEDVNQKLTDDCNR